MNIDTTIRPVIYSRDNGRAMKWGFIRGATDTGAQFDTYLQAVEYAQNGAAPIVAATIQWCS